MAGFFETVKYHQRRLGKDINFLLYFGIVIFLLVPMQLWFNSGVGVRPRVISMESIMGIMVMPFFHMNLQHFIANIIPLLFLGIFVILHDTRPMYQKTTILIIISGILTWIIGRKGTEHIGSSGLVFAYFGYMIGGIGRGFWSFNRLWKICLGSCVFYLYWYLIPSIITDAVSSSHVSWEGHLSGLISGIILVNIIERRE